MFLWEEIIRPDAKPLRSSHCKLRYRLGKPIEPGNPKGAIFEATTLGKTNLVPAHVVIKVQIPPCLEDLYLPRAAVLKAEHDREFEMLRTVQHIDRGIVRLYDWGMLDFEEDPAHAFRFLVFEDVRGGTLQASLNSNRNWHLYEKVRAIYKLAQTIDKMHKASVLHGNITLSTIALRDRDDLSSMTPLDFSFTRRIKSNKPIRIQEKIGIPTRRPPEYIYPTKFPLLLEADIFSLGQIFTALLWSIRISDGIGELLEIGNLDGYMPSVPEKKEENAAHHLIRDMLELKPSGRPTAAEVCIQLRRDYPEAFGINSWEKNLHNARDSFMTLAKETLIRVRASLSRRDK